MSINTLYTSVQATTIDELGARVEQFLLDHPEYAINGAPFVAENGTDYIQTFCLKTALNPIDFPKLCTKVTGKYIGNREKTQEGKPIYYVGDSVDPWDFEGWITLKDDPDQTTSLHYILRDEWYVSPRVITEEFFEKPAEQQVIKLFYKWATDKSGDIPIKPEKVKMVSISVHDPLKKSKYFEHEAFEKDGLSISVHYNNGSAKVVYESCYEDAVPEGFKGFKVSRPNTESEGSKPVTITYTEKYGSEEVTCTCTTYINVVVDWDSQIVITKFPDRMNYRTSDSVDLTGLEIEVIKDSKKRYRVAYNDYPSSFSCTGDLSTVGDVAVDLAYLDAHSEGSVPLHTTFKVHVIGMGRLGTPGIDLVGNFLSIYAGADPDPNGKTRNAETYTIYADDVAVATIDSEGNLVERLGESNDAFTKDISRIDLTTALYITSAYEFKVQFPEGWGYAEETPAADAGMYYGDYGADVANLITWKKLNVAQEITSKQVNGYHSVWLRGVGLNQIKHTLGNAGLNITSDTTTAKFWISGNFEALLDYYAIRKGSHPQLAECAFEMLLANNKKVETIPTIDTPYVPRAAFASMFQGCKGLTSVDFVPSLEIGERAFLSMFYGCTGLKNVSVFETEDTILGEYACSQMFQGCTALVDPPKLPSMWLAPNCYNTMFEGCTAITDLSEYVLPATLLAEGCYFSMFEGCTNLIDVPAKNTAAVPASKSYMDMLKNTGIKISKKMGSQETPAVDYDKMFKVGPVAEGVTQAYTGMFSGCHIPTGEGSFDGTPAPGTEYWIAAGYPNVQYSSNISSFTISCGQKSWDGVLEYSTDKYHWTEWNGETITAVLNDQTYLVYMRGLGVTRLSVDGGNLNINGYAVGLGGNIAALLDHRKARRNAEIAMQPGALKYAFKNCGAITHVDDNFMNYANLKLSDGCFEGMFAGSGITSAPLLPWTELSDRCYSGMFEGCRNLWNYASGFALAATELAPGCYQKMFKDCRILSTPVALEANHLASACYSEMYANCPKMKSLPILKSDAFPPFCYERMFENCTNISLSNKKTAELVNVFRIPHEKVYEGIPGTKAVYSMFNHCNLINVPSTPAFNTKYWTGKIGPIPPDPPIDEYFRISNGTTGAATIKFGNTGDAIVGARYRINSETGPWTAYTAGAEITLPAGQFLYFIAYGWASTLHPQFTITNSPVAISGNIMSLVDGFIPDVTITTPYQFKEMFKDQTKITSISALRLPAERISEGCYDGMFSGCTGITTSEATTLPELPALQTEKYCYRNMFYHCSGITKVPELPATTMTESCYEGMFDGCTEITSAPALPATTLAKKCYYNMFYGCTKLTTAPELATTELDELCYSSMFHGCTALTAAPALPATTLAKQCYSGMFQSCTALQAAPALPATTLAEDCYFQMFKLCNHLIAAPALPATTLADYCYCEMFSECTLLDSTPDLSATTLAKGCYRKMFENCTGIVNVPALPATTLPELCYDSMFWGCSGLKISQKIADYYFREYKIPSSGKMEPAGTGSLSQMFKGTNHEPGGEEPVYSSTSTNPWTLYRYSTHPKVANPIIYEGENIVMITCETNGAVIRYTTDGSRPTESSAIYTHPIPVTKDMTIKAIAYKTGYIDSDPVELKVHYKSGLPLCFTANQANSTVNFVKVGTKVELRGTTETSTDGTNWITYIPGTTGAITLTNVGDKVYFRSAGWTGAERTSPSEEHYMHFVMSGSIFASGCVNSLLGGNTVDVLQYYKLFCGCDCLVVPPELPDKTLNIACYAAMFRDCASLAVAPMLPATELKEECYSHMFDNCTSMITAPALPATTLAKQCYSTMFYNCSALIAAPELPATTLVENCYMQMFYDCTSLTTVPTLPATTLVASCYSQMFHGCTSLVSIPSLLPATTLADSCYSSMFYGCTSLKTAPTLPAMTLATECYHGMFSSCTSLTIPPALPATALAEKCYLGMFLGCTGIRITSDVTTFKYSIPSENGLSATGYRAVEDMFEGTSGETEDPTPTVGSQWTKYIKKCAAPTITQTEGSNEVRMRSKAGDAIHYTTDGSTPTSSSTLYTGPITLTKAVTVKAIAITEGWADSEITSKDCPYTPPVVADPVITIDTTAGTYGTVTMTCGTSDATIRYTTNGEDPTEESTAYVNALPCPNRDTTYKAKAFKIYCTSSNIVEKTFTGEYNPVPISKTGVWNHVYFNPASDADYMTAALDSIFPEPDETREVTLFRTYESEPFEEEKWARIGLLRQELGAGTGIYVWTFTFTHGKKNTVDLYSGIRLYHSGTSHAYGIYEITTDPETKITDIVDYAGTDVAGVWSDVSDEQYKQLSEFISWNRNPWVTVPPQLVGYWMAPWATPFHDNIKLREYGFKLNADGTSDFFRVYKGAWTSELGETCTAIVSKSAPIISITVQGITNPIRYKYDLKDDGTVDVTGLDGVTAGKVMKEQTYTEPGECTITNKIATITKISSEKYVWMVVNLNGTTPETQILGGNFYTDPVDCATYYNQGARIFSYSIVDNQGYCQLIRGKAIAGALAAPTVTCTNNVVTMSAADGAAIHYTDDGAIPTTESTLYTAPIELTKTTTFKAIAAHEGMVSPVTIVTFSPTVIPVPTPINPEGTWENFYVNGNADPNIALSKLKEIYFTGLEKVAFSTYPEDTPSGDNYASITVMNPQENSDNHRIISLISRKQGDHSYATNIHVYGTGSGHEVGFFESPMMYPEETKITGVQTYAGCTISGELAYKNFSTEDYAKLAYFTSFNENPWATPKCAAPVISQESGSNDVTMSCTTEGATIHYTNDGSTPTATSPTYTTTITITQTTTFKAIAVKTGYDNSEVTTKECPYTAPIDPLCLTTGTDNVTVVLTTLGTGSFKGEMQYKVNSGSWSSLSVGTEITLANTGDKMYMRGHGWSGYDAVYLNWTGAIAASGNIMSLTNFTTPSTVITEPRQFEGFFGYNAFTGTLTSAPTLPATTLTERCYYCMFMSCEALAAAPTLPAITLADRCYAGMFLGCTSLTAPPALPATTLAGTCYAAMFQGCTALASLPSLSATTLPTKCYYQMFSGCSGITLQKDAGTGYTLYRMPAGESTTITSSESDSLEEMLYGCALTSDPSWVVDGKPILNEGVWIGYLANPTPKCATPVISQTTGSNDVTMTCSTEGATIHYTDNGTDPTAESATYTTTITITATKTFKAIAVKTGYDNSDVAEKLCPYTPPTTKPYLEIESTDETKTFQLCMGSYNSDEDEWLEYNLAGMWDGELEYSTDDGASWTTWSKGHEHVQGERELEAAALIPGTATNKLRVRATSEFPNTIITDLCHYSDADSTTSHFRLVVTEGVNVTVNLSGNLMTLLNSDTPPTVLTEENARAFYSLFCGMPVVDAHDLNLTATTLAEECYGWMFDGCTSLTAAPALPATTLAGNCYGGMFAGCSSLVTPPELPVTTLAYACYANMFDGCTNLATAPALPATVMAESCYANMLEGTAITAAPDLSQVTTLADYCFDCMFADCTSLTTAPALPLTTLAKGCYYSMFWGCTSLTTAPALPATSLADYCYGYMFQDCTSLTGTPELPAAVATEQCYIFMFCGCSALTTINSIGLTDVSQPEGTDGGCCESMFQECTSLTTLPNLPATALSGQCYQCMFKGCSNIKLYQTTGSGHTTEYKIPAEGTVTSMVENSCSGMFLECNFPEGAAESWCIDGTPVLAVGGSWTGYLAGPAPTIEPLCFTLVENAPGWIKFSAIETCTPGTFEYSTDGTNWSDYSISTQIDVQSVGDKLYLKGTGWTPDEEAEACKGMYFVMQGVFRLSGNIMALIGSDTITKKYQFHKLFLSCSSVGSLPSLPATTLTDNCYESMFEGCSNLYLKDEESGNYNTPVRIPTAGAGTAGNDSLKNMFSGCTWDVTSHETPEINITYYLWPY